MPKCLFYLLRSTDPFGTTNLIALGITLKYVSTNFSVSPSTHILTSACGMSLKSLICIYLMYFSASFPLM